MLGLVGNRAGYEGRWRIERNSAPPIQKKTYEDYVGVYGLRGLGRGEWRKNVGTDRHHLPDQDPGRRL